MNPALENHLNRLHGLALKASALSQAIYALTDDAEYQDTVIEMSAAVSLIVRDITAGLDCPARFAEVTA